MRFIFSTFVFCSVLVSACSAQSIVSFDEQYKQGLKQNPPGVTLSITTADGGSKYSLHSAIPIALRFTSTQLHVYTVEPSIGNAATVSTDFVVEGPGITAPLHSLTFQPHGYPCCSSKRRYLGQSPVALSERLDLGRAEMLAKSLDVPTMTMKPHGVKPGEYLIFAQTRNVMRGWPKSQKDSFHSESDIVVTSSNVLHITLFADKP